jgi:parallel beta-helix repeat protein
MARGDKPFFRKNGLDRWTFDMSFAASSKRSRSMAVAPAPASWVTESPQAALPSAARLFILASSVVFLGLMFGISSAAATDFYVNHQIGNDSNQGAAGAPFLTLRRATRALMPGDRLFVASGTYRERLILANSGTAQQPIAVVGEGRPLIEASDDAIVISGNYVELSGFEAHAVGLGSAILVGEKNHHVRILNNVARDSGCAGIGVIQSDYVVIEGNRVFGNARRSPWQCSGVSIYQAVNFDHAPDVHNVIRRNLVYDNMNIAVVEQISHSGGKTTDGNGIIIDDDRHVQGTLGGPAYDGLTLIENNIVVDNGGRGIQLFQSDNVIVRNNTSFHNLKDDNLQSLRAQGEFSAMEASTVRFINNIAVPLDPTTSGFVAVETVGNNTWNFNLTEGGAVREQAAAQKGWGLNNILVSTGANFVAPSADVASADFHLRPGSLAMGAGSLSDAPRDDFSGASRPSRGPIDLGALQSSRAAP